MTNKIVRDMLVDDLREALSESKQQVTALKDGCEILRYNLWMCRKNAYQAFMATAGVLPNGYESRMEHMEAQQSKKVKAKK